MTELAKAHRGNLLTWDLFFGLSMLFGAFAFEGDKMNKHHATRRMDWIRPLR